MLLKALQCSSTVTGGQVLAALQGGCARARNSSTMLKSSHSCSMQAPLCRVRYTLTRATAFCSSFQTQVKVRHPS